MKFFSRIIDYLSTWAVFSWLSDLFRGHRESSPSSNPITHPLRDEEIEEEEWDDTPYNSYPYDSSDSGYDSSDPLDSDFDDDLDFD